MSHFGPQKSRPSRHPPYAGLKLGGASSRPGPRRGQVEPVNAPDDPAPTPERKALAPYRIALVVDRDDRRYAHLQTLVQSNLLRCERAATPAQALDVLARLEIALVVVNLDLPNLDAMALAFRIRGLPDRKRLPIVFVVPATFEGDVAALEYTLGFVSFLRDPIHPRAFEAKLADLLPTTAGASRELRPKGHDAEAVLSIEPTLLLGAPWAPGPLDLSAWHDMALLSLPIGFYKTSLDGFFSGPRVLGSALEKATGFEAKHFIDDQDLWPAHIHPDDISQVFEELELVALNGTSTFAYRWRCADGAVIEIQDQARLVRDDTGRACEIRGMIQNISRQANLERQVLQSLGSDNVALLAEGLAHEFNNMLSVIIWNLDPLVHAQKQDGPNRNRVKLAINAAMICTDLVRNWVSFVRPIELSPQRVNLGEAVARMSRLLSPVLGKALRLEVQIDDTSPDVLIDPARLDALLFDIAIEALSLAADGGALTLAVDHAPWRDSGGRLSVKSRCALSATISFDRPRPPRPPEAEANDRIFVQLLGHITKTVHAAKGHLVVDQPPGTERRIRMVFPAVSSMSVEPSA